MKPTEHLLDVMQKTGSKVYLYSFAWQSPKKLLGAPHCIDLPFMFVTLFVGVLDLATGHLCYCNAGHDAPYIQTEQLPCNPNLPIGVMSEWKFTEQETMLNPNTMIFLYTDGLTEAENSAKELFGEERVTDVINSHLNDSYLPQELIEDMTNAVHQFVCGTEQSDDITMVAIKYTHEK